MLATPGPASTTGRATVAGARTLFDGRCRRRPAWASARRRRRRPPVARPLAGRIDRLHLRLPAQQAGRGRAPAAAARGARGRGGAAGRRAQRARADRAARGGPARRADGPARGDRAGARAPRGGGRRHGDVGIAAADRGGAPRQPAGGRGGRVDRRRQAPAASPSRSCAPRPAIAAPPGTRLARVKDERGADRARRRDERPRRRRAAAQLAHDAAGLAAEQRALEENAERLDAQLADLRDKAARCATPPRPRRRSWIRSSPARRQAASAMAASIAGRLRDRVDAEREIADLTAQIGRVAADVRPPHATLLSGYQNIDRLTETIGDRDRPAGGHRAGARPLRSPQAARRRRPGDLHAGRHRRRRSGPCSGRSARGETLDDAPPPSRPAAAGRRRGVTAPSHVMPVIASR